MIEEWLRTITAEDVFRARSKIVADSIKGHPDQEVDQATTDH